ncbi:anhydro-N-acetylmuramic acid kinase [Endozoicomonas numazuensis]|uniref:Anhydro-N-acetylmuramic acid kinase n=1 Tax=Endozoicomonas numazuensis TaxID=1137799 RepID=A0A081NKW3_9GAMM|nr:anhydro-N-acetylmuramic acid kinase [Endozoicomonas numazuensis]KEQ19086.1 anhydro-N-acetylmuramic acid kinase [Endozoicomonas numazuensis]
MPEYFIGLMSGTSLDGIDAALVEFKEPPSQQSLQGNCRQIQTLSHPLPDDLREQLLALTLPGPDEIERMAIAEPAFARESANAIQQLLDKAGFSPHQVTAIGSHGQTIRHRPEKGFTLQIGDPSLIAELTGIQVVADFRRRDVAAGGQGAPLVPAFHKAVFSSLALDRVILNIGGMSNISLLPTDSQKPVTGFDTGPGNVLMDYWCQHHLNQPYDNKGQWAASGSINDQLLNSMLNDSYFSEAPPKSTGRERFNPGWLESHLKDFSDSQPEDVAATLTLLTAKTIALDICQYAPSAKEILVCGGGASNKYLMALIEDELNPLPVSSTASLGIEPDWVEAVAFAWLARQTLTGKPGNLPAVTGASGERILGAIYPAD